MAKQINIVIHYLGLGVMSLGAGWDWSVRPSQQIQTGIGRHFDSIGRQLSNACQRYKEEHPEMEIYA